MINLRMKLDFLSTSNRYEKRKLDAKIVTETWSRTIEGENNLSDDWILSNAGVLVGMG